jgi:hypothetical protein
MKKPVPVAKKKTRTVRKFVRPQSVATVARTSAGLREALFQEIEALRAGKSDSGQAMAVAKLAQQIVNSVRVEIEFASKFKPGEKLAAEMPVPLKLAEAA